MAWDGPARAKVAAIQLAPLPDRERTLARAVELVHMAADRGAKVVAFPELFALPWFPGVIDKAHFELAEPADGPTVTALRAAAAARGVVVVAPFFEKKIEGRCYNSAAVIDAGGDLLGVYRKVHVPQIPYWEERSYFAAGDAGFPVFRAGGLAIGVALGWDVLFPETARMLALAGAHLIVVPTASTKQSHDLWERSIGAAAFASGLFILRVNRIGSGEGQVFHGASFCVSPFGDVIDQASGEGEGLLLVEINPRDIELVRREWPLIKDRRPECYLGLAGLEVRPAAKDGTGGPGSDRKE
jgi:N-carbamoylputrescine amidase